MFLGAIKAGIVPVAVNTLLTTAEYRFMLEDSRARACWSEPLLDAFRPLSGQLPFLQHVIVSGGHGLTICTCGSLRGGRGRTTVAPTTRDDACFWLYSSVHRHTRARCHPLEPDPDCRAVCPADPGSAGRPRVLRRQAVLRLWLGNTLTFPLAVGAGAVLMAERPTPSAVFQRLTQLGPTIFYGVPTLYSTLLASPELPTREQASRVHLRR